MAKKARQRISYGSLLSPGPRPVPRSPFPVLRSARALCIRCYAMQCHAMSCHVMPPSRCPVSPSSRILCLIFTSRPVAASPHRPIATFPGLQTQLDGQSTTYTPANPPRSRSADNDTHVLFLVDIVIFTQDQDHHKHPCPACLAAHLFVPLLHPQTRTRMPRPG